MAGQNRSAEPQALSIAELVERLSEQTARLVRDEIRLARLEVQEKGKRAGIGVGMFGGGGLLALYGGAAVVAGIVLVLATVIAAWIAALIVGVALLLLAGLFGLLGKKQLQNAAPPVPEQAIRGLQQDVDAVREAAKTKGTGR
jgi:uncharacterized membrane protein YqjE